MEGERRERKSRQGAERFPGTVSFCGKGKQTETSRCNAPAEPK